MALDVFITQLNVDAKMNPISETLFDLDDRKDIETIFTSWKGILTTVVSATVSTSASIFVIWLIHTSNKQLARSVYHRILFGMSVANIIQSIAMALTTLPMPTDMIYTGFQGLIIGNKYTCKAQGFFVAIGAVSGMVYNAMLSVYYLCSINFSMADYDFRQYVEPFFHLSGLVFSLMIGTLLLVGDCFNPSPTATSWCGVSVYPYWLHEDDKISEVEIGKLALLLSFAMSAICITTIIVSMIIIVANVRKRDQRRIEVSPIDQGEDQGEEGGSRNSIDNRSFQNTKIIRNQAITYSIVNLFGFVIMGVLPYTRNISGNDIPPVGWQVAYLVLRPLQGLFNSCIFVYHKAYNLRRENNDLNVGEAIFAVVRGIEADERALSNFNGLDSRTSTLFGFVPPSGADEERVFSVYSSDSDEKDIISADMGFSLPMEQSIQDLSGFSIRQESSTQKS